MRKWHANHVKRLERQVSCDLCTPMQNLLACLAGDPFWQASFLTGILKYVAEQSVSTTAVILYCPEHCRTLHGTDSDKQLVTEHISSSSEV